MEKINLTIKLSNLNLNVIKRIKDSNLILYIYEFLYFDEIFTATQINRRIKNKVEIKFIFPIFDNLKIMLEIEYNNKLSDFLFSTKEHYLEKIELYNTDFIKGFSSVEKFKIFLIKYLSRHFKSENEYKDENIFKRGNKLTIYKKNEIGIKFNDLIFHFISINKIKRINDSQGKLMECYPFEIDINEYNSSFINDLFCRNKIYLYKTLISLGTFDLSKLLKIFDSIEFICENLKKIKLGIESYELRYFYYNKMGESGKLIKNNFTHLTSLTITNFKLHEEDNLIEFLNNLYNDAKILKLIKIKNVMLKDFFSYYKSHPDDTKLYETYFIYHLHKFKINSTKFKIVGGYIESFYMACEFLNKNINVEKLVLKGQILSEIHFIEFLNKIQKESKIKIIKTSLLYSGKIIKTLSEINLKLDKNIVLC